MSWESKCLCTPLLHFIHQKCLAKSIQRARGDFSFSPLDALCLLEYIFFSWHNFIHESRILISHIPILLLQGNILWLMASPECLNCFFSTKNSLVCFKELKNKTTVVIIRVQIFFLFRGSIMINVNAFAHR